MTGPEHYREAERLLEEFSQATEVDEADMQMVLAQMQGGMAHAQVHATLALAAATALHGVDPSGIAWLEATS
jgi:hypothetical protein